MAEQENNKIQTGAKEETQNSAVSSVIGIIVLVVLIVLVAKWIKELPSTEEQYAETISEMAEAIQNNDGEKLAHINCTIKMMDKIPAQYFQRMTDAMNNSFEKEFGEITYVSIEQYNERKLEQDEKGTIENYYRSAYSQEIYIQDGYEVDAYLVINGTKSKRTDNVKFDVVLISGSGWKLPISTYDVIAYDIEKAN